MKEFDYIILGGGCAGLSLAYELDVNLKLKDKSLAIVEARSEYKRDKTWSFWKISDHNFEDCVIKSWDNFSINTKLGSIEIINKEYPYQTVDSSLFYNKILNRIKQNKNIQFFQNTNQLNLENSFIFNSITIKDNYKENLWQHFKGIEIETEKNIFDDEIFNLMDFACDQRNRVHFFYTLPFTKRNALVETTWISELNNENLEDYEDQIDNYLGNDLNIRNCKINFKEKGAIPLFREKINNSKEIFIGSAGGMTRLSTGYTFLNIQEQSKYIRENIENIRKVKPYKIQKKYDFLDKILLRVLKNNSSEMGNIFLKVFNVEPKIAINFLSNKSDLSEDLKIVLKMPKWKFLKELI